MTEKQKLLLFAAKDRLDSYRQLHERLDQHLTSLNVTIDLGRRILDKRQGDELDGKEKEFKKLENHLSEASYKCDKFLAIESNLNECIELLKSLQEAIEISVSIDKLSFYESELNAIQMSKDLIGEIEQPVEDTQFVMNFEKNVYCEMNKIPINAKLIDVISALKKDLEFFEKKVYVGVVGNTSKSTKFLSIYDKLFV